MKLVVILVVATLAVVLSMPAVQDEEVLLDEAWEHHVAAAVRAVHAAESKVKAATPPPPPKPVKEKDTTSHHVAAAVIHVHKGSKKVKPYDPNEMAQKAKWKRESVKAHWHCRHCHKSCKTDHCRKWCHKTFCYPSYTGGFPLGRYLPRLSLSKGERVTPGLVRADHDVNRDLTNVETTTKMSVLRKAARALKRFEHAKKHDMHHFKRNMKREDMLNKSTFPDGRKRKANRKLERGLRKLHRKAVAKREAKSEKKAEKVAAKDMSYVEGAKVANKVGKMMKMTSMLGALEETTKLDTKFLDSKKTAGQRIKTTAQASTTKVAAKLAKMQVKLKTAGKSRL